MNLSFERLMTEATRLTRAGSLRKATAAIQAALGVKPRAQVAPAPGARAGADSVVIDVEACVVEAEPTTPMQRAYSPVGPAAPVDVIEPITPITPVTPIAPIAPVKPIEPAESEAVSGFIAGSHTDAAGMREYKLFVPPLWQGRALPLVVMLHGCTQDPDDFAAGTGMNQAALERGFFVLYPAQASSANVSRCWNWFKHNHQARGRGEPAMLAGMTLDVVERWGIDPNRVYVAGLSAGGAMAAILGQAYPEIFSAVGVHSGLPVGAARDVTGAFSAMQNGAGAATTGAKVPPTIVFHGDHDSTVHPKNGEQVAAASAQAETDAATPEVERARSANGREYTRRIWREPGGEIVAEHWAVHGAGHAWSGGQAGASYTDGQGPDASAEMLRFFFSQARR